ncbi:MAG TPA: septation protein A [Burkholderiaceae bacterium]
MKILLDFLPLAFFFLTYKVAGLHPDASAQFATHWLGALVQGGVVGPKEAPVLLATVVVAAATLLQVVWMKANRRRIDLLLWINLTLILVLGGITVWLHNETFIKWKPSVVYWLMGLALWSSQTLFGHNLLRQTLGAEIDLPDAVWRRMNFLFVAFFGLMGLVNVWVVYSFSTDAWAKFHTFGTTGLMVVFVLGVGVYMSRHLDHAAPPAATDESRSS